MKSLFTVLAAIAGYMFSAHCYADYPSTKQDFQRLPAYCEARMDKTGLIDDSRWVRVFGADFIHFHHYCAGLHTLNVASALLDQQAKKPKLLNAAQQFDYMINHASQQLVLFPEIYLKKGQVLSMLGQTEEAISTFATAIKLKSDYVAAYRSFADFYIEQGRFSSARELINKGLKYSPDSKSLQRRKAKIKQLLGTAP